MHLVLNVVEQLSCLMSAEKQEQGQCKPRQQGVHTLPRSPASSTLDHWLEGQVESWLCRLRGDRSVLQQLLVAECSLACSRILEYTPELKWRYHRDTHKLFALRSLHCMCLCPPPLPLLEDFVFLPPHDKLSLPSSPNCLFQAYGCMKSINCSQTCQCLRMRSTSFPILEL